jgi:hypothetical protein
VLSNAIGGVDAIVRSSGRDIQRKKPRLPPGFARTFAPEYAKLGTPSPGDTPNTIDLRAHLFELLGYYGKDRAVLAQARQIAEKYVADPGLRGPDFGPDCASPIAARNGDAALFDKLQKVAETSTNPELQEGLAAPARRV